MKYLDEYRNADAARKFASLLARITTRPWTIMEVCGGQTHAIVRFGIDELLPAGIGLVHGPGCPVCVTPVAMVDRAIAIAGMPEVIFCSFGDMMRVPGTESDLLRVKANGGDVRMVYAPSDALEIAARNPHKQVVFFAVGFETTAPANALAVYLARQRGLRNFSMLVSQVLVPPAMQAILEAPRCRVQGFLAAGHVCTVMGLDAYGPLSERFRVPIVVTGFEPLDILHGIVLCVQQLEEGRAQVENQYVRAVRPEGNRRARALLAEVFCIVHRHWRGIGEIPHSGLSLRPEYAGFDAERRFPAVFAADRASSHPAETGTCISGEILQGLKKPCECPAFGRQCTPESPLGATMVSSEGACAAYYRYRGLHIADAFAGKGDADGA
jgi:hydrogenase expression/formation protein HypD